MSSSDTDGRGGMHAMFWTWMGIVVVGLTIMIIVPLTGN